MIHVLCFGKSFVLLSWMEPRIQIHCCIILTFEHERCDCFILNTPTSPFIKVCAHLCYQDTISFFFISFPRKHINFSYLLFPPRIHYACECYRLQPKGGKKSDIFLTWSVFHFLDYKKRHCYFVDYFYYPLCQHLLSPQICRNRMWCLKFCLIMQPLKKIFLISKKEMFNAQILLYLFIIWFLI